MNMKRRLIVVLMIVAMMATLLPCVFASASDATTAKGYMVGNSLTISMSPRRFAALLASQDYNVTLGGQLLGDTSLPEHIGMREAGKEYGFLPWRRHSSKLNTETNQYEDTIASKPISTPGDSDKQLGLTASISNHYFTAMANEHFDFVTLQTYGSYADTHDKYIGFERDHTVSIGNKEYYEYQYLGDRQAIGIMIDYALKQMEEKGTGANTFLVYEAWTYQDKILSSKDSFSEFYNAAYNVPSNAGNTDILANTVVPNKNATEQMMSGLRADFAYLGEDAIRLVPAAAVLAALDEKIIAGELPGFAEYMERNAAYYIGSRNTTNPERQPKELLSTAYVQKYGIINLYTDAVHMASFGIDYNGSNTDGKYTDKYSQAYHWGEREGTLASYITAVTMYSVLTGYSPVGLPVDTGSTDPLAQYVSVGGSNARLDTVLDATLIRGVQETIFEVLCENKYTGITEDAPQRTAASEGHIGGNGVITRVAGTVVKEAPARMATEIALTIAENPMWTPVNVTEAIIPANAVEEKKKA